MEVNMEKIIKIIRSLLYRLFCMKRKGPIDLEVDPREVAMVHFYKWIWWDVVEDLKNKIKINGWQNIPKVAIFKLPEEVLAVHRQYEQLRPFVYGSFRDGLHRRTAAIELGIKLPCTFYENGDEVDMRKHGDNPSDFKRIYSGNWLKSVVNSWLEHIKPYLAQWSRTE